MRQPKISVIIPAYNAVDYITECMESIVHQTMKDDIECIAIDDGSDDGTERILDWYAENFENVTVVHQECISQANAWNRGLRMATGEYVAECDADDFCALNMYEKLYEVSEGKADAVRCGFFGCFPDGLLQENPPHINYKHLKMNPHELESNELALVFGRMHLLPAGIYRRQFLLDNGIFWREDGQNYEDTLVEFKIRSTATDYRYTNDCLYYYRRGNPNSGSATIFDETAICEQYDAIEAWNEEHGEPKFMEFMNSRRYYDYMWMLGRLPDEKKPSFAARMMKDFRLHPAKRDYFNKDEDFRNYCIIKYGAWTECGVMGC